MNRYGLATRPLVAGGPRLRILGLGLVGVLALTLPILAHAEQPGWKTSAPSPAPGIARMGGGGSNWHSAPGHMGQWRGGWVPPPGAPYGSGWPSYGVPAVPTYWVWGPSGGAFDYPFADWRGPHGGWGNP
jgi:hypothetical protein